MDIILEKKRTENNWNVCGIKKSFAINKPFEDSKRNNEKRTKW